MNVIFITKKKQGLFLCPSVLPAYEIALVCVMRE